MMTPEQRYLFDIDGYVYVKNALSPEELQKAQEAAERLINTPPDDMPPGFSIMYDRHHYKYRRGFAFDRALEHLTMHPSVWPIIKELTGNKPCLCNGTMAGGGLYVDTHEHDVLGLHVGDSQNEALGANRDGLNSPRGFGEPKE